MIFYIKNFIRSFLTHPKENFIILFDLMLTASVIFVLVQNYYFIKEKHDEFFYDDRVAKTFILSTEQERIGEITNNIKNQTYMFDMGLQLYDEINSTEMKVFMYYDSDIKTDGFDEETMSRIQKCAQVGGLIQANAISEYSLEGMGFTLSDGRWFTKEEYDNIYDLDAVPIIMGNNYKESFKLGDVISYDNGEKKDKAVVVGFFEKNSTLNYYGMMQDNFNEIIVYPISTPFFPREFEFYENDESDIERVKILSDGRLYCPDESIDVQKQINLLTAQYGFYPISAEPIDGTAYSETKTISERNLWLIGILAASASVICMISLGGIIYNKTLDDRRTYCIYMSVGIPLRKIITSLVLEMLLWTILSMVPVIVISCHEYKTVMVPLWLIVLYELFVVAISLVPSLKVISKCNIDYLMRNQMN
ncbi:MAG: hypothetical protein J6U54_02680 [Clostridiales bacterium]|nr:hypothetical protein [Clostridiales bacterium]